MPLNSPRFKEQPTLEKAAADNPVMKKWERDSVAVAIVQQALADPPCGIYMNHSLKGTTPDLGIPVFDGIYGDKTAEAVRALQSDPRFHLVKRDGNVGRETMALLDRLYPGVLLRPGLALVQREITVMDTRPIAARPVVEGGFKVGGTFHVRLAFIKDPANDYKKLEYRQMIKGLVFVAGVPKNEWFELSAGGRHQPLMSDAFVEDGSLRCGAYGHRSLYNDSYCARNDMYYSIDRETIGYSPDPLGGNVYIGTDDFGLWLGPGRSVLARGKPVEIRLEFKGQIVRCDTPGGPAAQLLQEKSWSEHGTVRMPL